MAKRKRSRMIPYRATSRHKVIADSQKALWHTVTQDSKEFVDTNRSPWHYTGNAVREDGQRHVTPHLRLEYKIAAVFVFDGGGRQPYTFEMLQRREERLKWERDNWAERQRILKRQPILRALKYGKITLKQEQDRGNNR